MFVIACDDATAPDAISLPWPQTEACDGLDDWPAAWSDLEQAAIDQIDVARSEGADCAERGKYSRAPALVRHPALDCAARFHALDMAEQGYFGRFDPDQRDERARAEAAGYTSAALVQHIAGGPRDALELVEQTWLPRAIPCSDLLSEEANQIGLGHVGDVDDELGTYWVVLLASPDP